MHKRLLILGGLLALCGCSDVATTTSDSSTTTTTGTRVLGFNSAITRTLGAGGAAQGNAVVAADFDQDGRSDFAVINSAAGSVSVFRSNGSDFDSEQQYTTLGAPLGLTTADLNKDGKPDLVVVGATQVSVLINSGTGTFPTHVEFTTGTDNRAAACGDFDGDGNVDIAVIDNGTNQLHVIYGDGSANVAGYTNFDYTTTSNTIHTPTQLVSGDFNADGILDVAIANGDAAYLAIWLNQSGNRGDRFPSVNVQNSFLDLPSGYGAPGLGVGDFDQDGRPDLIASATDGTGAQLRLFLNTASGIGIASGGVQSVSPQPRTVTVADYNGDGYLDALVVSRVGENSNGTGEADILLGNGGGVLTGQNRYVVSSGTTLAAGATGDFNADGRPDVVVVGTNSAFIFLNSSSTQ